MTDFDEEREAAEVAKAALEAVRRGLNPDPAVEDTEPDDSESGQAGRKLSEDDVARLDALFRAHSDQLFRHAMSVTKGPRAVAEDLVQEAFQQAARRWHVDRGRDELEIVPLRERSDEALFAWLAAVIRNKNVDRIRRAVVAADHQAVLVAEARQVEDDPASGVAGADQLRKMLLTLPPQRRRVAWLRWHEELSYKEIADRLGIAESTVRSHIEKACEQLRPVLTQTEEPEANSTERGERR